MPNNVELMDPGVLVCLHCPMADPRVIGELGQCAIVSNQFFQGDEVQTECVNRGYVHCRSPRVIPMSDRVFGELYKMCTEGF